PDHCVSRKHIDREALKVLYRLKDHGYIAYLVGGSVRDILLGRQPKDFDVGTNARPEEVRKLFRHSRIIGRRFRLVHVYFRGGKVIEVSTFRRRADEDAPSSATVNADGGAPPPRDENLYGTPEEDAFRRDLTINGLFYNIADFSVIDYVGGMEDLRRGLIRVIGDPDVRFARDPVRMLRAIRHAARAGFTVEPATWAAIGRHREEIRLCAVPRVRDEWLKDLRSGSAAAWARLMLESGLFTAVFPGYAPALEDDRSGDVRHLLLHLLAHLDTRIRSGDEPAEPELVALFAFPAMHHRPEWAALASERLRWPTHETRALLEEVLAPYDFRKATRDAAAQILASQWAIRLCLERGSWPKRVWNKASYPAALRLFNAVRDAHGEPPVGDAPHRDTAERPPKAAKPRRRRSRRGRRGRKREAERAEAEP
ncbi:polynucleotide adenylyltransferase PcnB, partial [Dissulfurirhabdus thermomarina]